MHTQDYIGMQPKDALPSAILVQMVRDYVRDIEGIYFSQKDIEKLKIRLEDLSLTKEYDLNGLKQALNELLCDKTINIQDWVEKDSRKAITSNNIKLMDESINKIKYHNRVLIRNRISSLEKKIAFFKRDQYDSVRFIKSKTFEILYDIDPKDVIERLENKELAIIEQLERIYG